MGNAGQINYSASKGGVIAMTKTCAREFASRRVGQRHRARFHPHRHDRQVERRTKKETHRFDPVDAAGRSPGRGQRRAVPGVGRKFAYITGQVISVNGGMYM
jgi:3-oxoacyl-[acyl-carrier protein] reductase